MAEKGKGLHSFELLFKQNYQRLCQHVFRITKDMDVAEYLVQELHYREQSGLAEKSAKEDWQKFFLFFFQQTGGG